MVVKGLVVYLICLALLLFIWLLYRIERKSRFLRDQEKRLTHAANYGQDMRKPQDRP